LVDSWRAGEPSASSPVAEAIGMPSPVWSEHVLSPLLCFHLSTCSVERSTPTHICMGSEWCTSCSIILSVNSHTYRRNVCWQREKGSARESRTGNDGHDATTMSDKQSQTTGEPRFSCTAQHSAARQEEPAAPVTVMQTLHSRLHGPGVQGHFRSLSFESRCWPGHRACD
jgi:hypothetical protein